MTKEEFRSLSWIPNSVFTISYKVDYTADTAYVATMQDKSTLKHTQTDFIFTNGITITKCHNYLGIESDDLRDLLSFIHTNKGISYLGEFFRDTLEILSDFGFIKYEFIGKYWEKNETAIN